MTIRLTDIDIDNTELLLGTILMHIEQDSHVMFLTPPSRATAVMQRLRVKLSRVRRKLELEGRPRKHFTMHHTIHRHTELDGTRHDCVVVWRTKSQRHRIVESLEDMVGHGSVL